MRLFGLIGHPLSHSFSEKYFTEKFAKDGITDCRYTTYDLPDLACLPPLLQKNPTLEGLNITLPYKEKIRPFLDHIDPEAAEIGAVNVLRIRKGRLKGYNTDCFGFKKSLLRQLDKARPAALILGTGGAAKAVAAALSALGICYQFVSRRKTGHPPHRRVVTYADLHTKNTENLLNTHRLLINATPLGTAPNIHTAPPIPYHQLTETHFLHDLTYNPRQTLFMQKGREKGANTKNGLEMLIFQAEKSWEIWNVNT